MDKSNKKTLSILKKNIVNAQGKVGQAWIDGLPQLLEQLQKDWSLTDLSPVSNMSWNYVALAKRQNVPVVLKISADEKAILNEYEALLHFDGHGSVALMDFKHDSNALLLQQAIPGITLKNVFSTNTDAVIKVYADLTKKISLPHHQEYAFPHIKEWCQVIDDINDPRIPKEYRQKAKQIRKWLFDTISHEYVCHGDLHLENILQNNHEWLVIDPKGIIGEMAFEAAAFDLLNDKEIELNDVTQLMKCRIHQLAEYLDISSQRLTAWIFLRVMLSIQWFIEDNGSPEKMLKRAGDLYPLLD